MKLTLKQKLRLAELHAKGTLTDAEKTELTALEAKAAEAKEDIEFIKKHFAPEDDEDSESAHGDEGESAVTEEELTTIIKSAIGDSLKDADKADDIVKSLTEKLGDVKGVTKEELEAIMAKHSPAEDIDKVVNAVKAAIPTGGVTSLEMKKIFEDFAATIKQPRTHEHPTEDMDFPIEHRSGNLSVAEKQLLNLCVMNVSEDAKSSIKASGGTIPTSMDDGISEKHLKIARSRGDRLAKSLRSGGVKTLTTGGVGEGAELIPTDLSSNLLSRLYLESQLATELLSTEVQMPTDPFKYPMTTTRPAFKTGAEAPGTDPTASNPGTQHVTLDAKKLIGMSDYSYEADEDAIVAVLDTILTGLGEGAASSFEGALIEGDDSTVHQHSDYQAVANHHTKLFKGFRKYGIAGGITVDFSAGNISTTNIKALRKKLKKYGIRPRDLLLISGPEAYNDLVGLDETLTYEKVGNPAAARILTGEADSIFGIRIVVSGEMREDLNASGVYDGSSSEKGGLILVHKPSWIVGTRRGFTVEVESDKKQQVNYVIASFRRAFVPTETPSTSLPLVAVGINSAVA